MKLVSQLKKKDLQSKKVLVRADLDAPVVDGKVSNSFRLEAALPTIKFLLKNGAKVTVIGHLGRRGESLEPVAAWLKQKVKNKNLIVLENLRRDDREEKNNLALAKELVAGQDLFVNDAFAASHRAHASIVSVTKLLPSYAGLQLEKEVKELTGALKPKKPLVLMVGGAKFESKLPVVNKFLPLADQVFIGGALANLFFKRLGYEVGKSFIDPQSPSVTSLIKSKKIILPMDVIVRRADSNNLVLKPELVRPGDKIMDVGPLTIIELEKVLKKAKTIIWNGPLGVCELGYRDGTTGLVKLLVESRAKVLVGGGDTVANFKLPKKTKRIFISTGGGAMLQFLATSTLPGIQALEK